MKGNFPAVQKIATLKVLLPVPANGLAIPAAVDLDPITFLNDSALDLLQEQGDKFIPVPFQTGQESRRTLRWLVPASAGAAVSYQLVKKGSSGPGPAPDSIRATTGEGTLTIRNGDQHLLQYVFKTVYPPAGIGGCTWYFQDGSLVCQWSKNGRQQ